MRRFLGGVGLGVYLALREGGAGIGPLEEEVPLVFAFSPLADSPVTTSARFAVVGQSPLTGRINDSLGGGQFAIEGKRTGYDALVIVGKAPEPAILIIDAAGPRLEPAGNLWGTTCGEAERLIAQRLGPTYQAAVIGPAGERLVRFALIAHAGRFAGRGGHGAVLGAKNLKAIAVHGSRRCRWAHPDRLVRAADELSRRSLGPATAHYRDVGTIENLVLLNRLRALPVRNFQQGSFEHAGDLSPDRILEVRGRVRGSCASCAIGCEHLFSAEPGRPAVRLEYESLFAFGPLCGIDDPHMVLKAVRRANELGLDTISTGGTIAFAMECAERGLIQADRLRFGDGSAVLPAERLAELVRAYNLDRGWSPEGWVPREQLEALGVAPLDD